MPTAPRNYDRRKGQYYEHASAATNSAAEASNNRRGRGQNSNSAVGASDEGFANSALSSSNRRHNRDSADPYKSYDREVDDYYSKDKLSRSGNVSRNEVAEDNRRRITNDTYRNRPSDNYRDDSYNSKSGGTLNGYSNRRGVGDVSDHRSAASDDHPTNRRGNSIYNSNRHTDLRSSSRDYAKDEGGAYGKPQSSTKRSQSITAPRDGVGGDRRVFHDKAVNNSSQYQRYTEGLQRRTGGTGSDKPSTGGGGSRNRETFEEGYHYEVKAAENQQRKLNEAVEEEMARLKLEREQRAAEEALKAHSRSSSFSLPLNEVDAMFRGQDSETDDDHQTKKESQQRSRFFDAAELDVIAPPKPKTIQTDPKDMLAPTGNIWHGQTQSQPAPELTPKSWDVSELEKQFNSSNKAAAVVAKVLTLAELETQLVVSSLIKEVPVANRMPITTTTQTPKPESSTTPGLSPSATAAPQPTPAQSEAAPKNSPTITSGKAPPPSYELRPRNSPSLQIGQQGGSVAPLAIPSSVVETSSADAAAPATPLAGAAASTSPASVTTATTGSPTGTQQPVARPTAPSTTAQPTTSQPYVTYFSPQGQGASAIQQPVAQAHQQYIVTQTAQGPQYYALPPNSDVSAYIASFAQRGITAHPVQPQQVQQAALPQQAITQQQLQLLYAQQQARNQQQAAAQQQLQMQQQQYYLQQQQAAAAAALAQQQAMAQQAAALAAQRGQQPAYYYAQQPPQMQQQVAYQYGTQQQPAYRAMTAEEYARALHYQQAAAAAGRR